MKDGRPVDGCGRHEDRPSGYLYGMQRYGTIIVVGGGCYGSYYLRQLERARTAGALAYEQVLVVDRDPACRVALTLTARGTETGSVALVVREWAAFFAEYLAGAAGDQRAARDAIVPSPLMPHLMFDWLVARARSRWPERVVEPGPLGREPAIPWQRTGSDGTQYVSFAEWECPINCIEPAMCPKIRGPRTWSIPAALRAYVAAERARGRNLAGPVLLHCTHRAFGVGMFDTRDVLAADRLVAEAGDRGPAEVLVGTVSHCHGAVALLAIGT